MSDEIIEFYKKAKDPEESQKPIEEQQETFVKQIKEPVSTNTNPNPLC